MNKERKKLIVLEGIILILILFVILSQCNLQGGQKNQNNITENNIQNVENANGEDLANDSANTVNDEIISNKSSTEIPILTEEDEQTVEVQETEAEGFEEQGIIAYNGAEKTPNVQLGEYSGLTYYSQIDKRWKNKMYSSVGNTAQTIGTSGCGPTAAAMVVSSIKGNITPDQMADLYMKYGYRSANQGTYWSAFKWTADVFDIGYSEYYKLDDAIAKLKDNHYIIASCNQGLFTYGGHFVVLVGLEGNYIKIYDSYLYNGKYDVASRRGKAIVKGNTTYVSLQDFRQYANYKKFFCFKNDRTNVNENNNHSYNANVGISKANYQVKIIANGGLNIRAGASTSYPRVGGYAKGTIVTILAESNGFGKTDRGWISLNYTSTNIGNSSVVGTSGQTKKLARASILYSNSNLTGYRYNYKTNTTVTILENVSANVDKVRVNVTGRVAYINTNNYSSVSGSSNVGTVKIIKNCVLYSNSNLTGYRYQYKDNTSVVVLQHVNSYVDKVRVRMTGRVAYINVGNYK
ncbi:peptidoglycan-binding domain 1 protein [Clostridium sp. CAG:470]|nr:MAG: hypothetical protein BHW03_06720 [Clostridium sp. 28_17]CDE13754.1 peptidoglycan-binding domain 1 protein [Clostridium sp. CAG:470]